jgi:hypothetical protein
MQGEWRIISVFSYSRLSIVLTFLHHGAVFTAEERASGTCDVVQSWSENPQVHSLEIEPQ